MKKLILFVLASLLVLAGCALLPGGENPLATATPTSVVVVVHETAAPQPTQAPIIVRETAIPAPVQPIAVPTNASEPALTASDSNDGFWGPAGQAPQTRSDAALVLGVPESALTELNPKAGDPLKIGWVIWDPPAKGESPKIFTAKLPAGTCVDYIRSSGQITGSTEWHVKYPNADWNRAFMNSDGTHTGVKVTIYWTQCERGNGEDFTPSLVTATSVPSFIPATSVPSAAAGCPATFAGYPLKQLGDGGCKLEPTGRTLTDAVPAGWFARTQNGVVQSGQPLNAEVATFYKNGS